jgi:hypothetical protein
VTVAPGSTLYLDVRNTGNTIWSPTNGNGYQVVCVSGCPNTAYSYVLIADVAPGDTYRFSIIWTTVLASASSYPGPITYHTHWRVYHKWYPMQEAFFGSDMQLDITESSEQMLLQQPVPTCNDPANMTWNVYNAGSGNTIVCTSSGLLIQQGSSSPPRVDAAPNLAAYIAVQYAMSIHVHFDADSTTT